MKLGQRDDDHFPFNYTRWENCCFKAVYSRLEEHEGEKIYCACGKEYYCRRHYDMKLNAYKCGFKQQICYGCQRTTCPNCGYFAWNEGCIPGRWWCYQCRNMFLKRKKEIKKY